ncbi:DUF1648 domain-containing protein [Streptomyces sp. A 4/2]|uniref:DUF1648 domain-containing protein n=1 Tax=Streptomyces sp. A 4/2 TaxID=2934314 RepID=UPI00202404B1|nr:DUF1648 domain-containing protein [Streptomyces sp. A 4/2]
MGPDRIRRVAVTGLPFLLAYVVDLVLFVRLRDRLPHRLATHFTGTGQANGTSGQLNFFIVLTALTLGLGLVWVLVSRGVRGLIVTGWAVAGFCCYLMAATLYANLRTSPELPLWQIAVAAGVAAVSAAVGRGLSRSLRSELPPAEDGPVERLDHADGETLGWARYAGTQLMWILLLAAIGTALVVLLTAGWQPAVPPLLLGLVLLLFARPCVTVDRRGLTVSTGWLPWPRLRVPLNEVERATSREVDALKEFGGWGYRVRAGRSGLILRSGEAIVIRRTNGRDFAVTVDGSADAAALLNTLADRQGSR